METIIPAVAEASVDPQAGAPWRWPFLRILEQWIPRAAPLDRRSPHYQIAVPRMNEKFPPYDFQEALSLPLRHRLEHCVSAIEQEHRKTDYAAFTDIPPIPPGGATAQELHALETALGVVLPEEYRVLLQKWKYLDITDGQAIWGLDYNGVAIGRPWISRKHDPQKAYLVVGNYWKYADGDQLLIDLDSAEHPVMLYRHEDGPIIEIFAPSLSLALWRMVHDTA